MANIHLDVLLLQELVVNDFKLRLLMSNWNGEYVVLDYEKGKGGAICVVSSLLVLHILAKGVDPMSHCCWMTMMLSRRVWGFYFLYAPNDPIGHTH
jgi:hypothetical protein